MRSAREPAAWLCGFAAVLIPVAVFWPVLSNGFVNWDDPFLILENPRIRGLSADNIRWMFSSLFMTTYQPFGWLAYALLFGLFGLNASAFHGASLALHAACTGVLFFILWDLVQVPRGQEASSSRPSPSPALSAASCVVAALLWSLHPLQVESVAWATEIPDLLASLFFLLSIAAYLGGARRRGTGRSPAPWLFFSIALFTASGLSRWKGFWLPAALVFLDLGPLARLPADPRRWASPASRRIWLEKAPFALLAAGIVLINHAAKGRVEGLRFSGSLSDPVGAAAGVFFYAWKAVFPRALWPIYTLNGPISPLGIPTGAAALGALGVTGFFFLLRGRLPSLLGGWALFVIALAPTFVAGEEGLIFGQDHYAYLALAALALPLAQGLLALRRPMMIFLVGVLILTPFALHSRRQAAHWKDSFSLWEHAVSMDAQPCIALRNLGAALIEERRFPEAAFRLQGLPGNCPRNSPGWREAGDIDLTASDRARVLTNLAAGAFESGQSDQAARYLTSALQSDPNLPETHNSMGIVFLRAGNRDWAIRHFRRALELAPDNAQARSNLERLLPSPPPRKGPEK